MKDECTAAEIEALIAARKAISVRMQKLRNKPLTKENRAYIRSAIDILLVKKHLLKGKQ